MAATRYEADCCSCAVLHSAPQSDHAQHLTEYPLVFPIRTCSPPRSLTCTWLPQYTWAFWEEHKPRGDLDRVRLAAAAQCSGHGPGPSPLC